jgi:hypothetical protein
MDRNAVRRHAGLIWIGLLGSAVLGLAWLAYQRQAAPPPAPAPSAPAARVEFDRFSARHERSPGGERLSVSLRLRAGADAALPCFVFVVARNDRVTPKRWAIWPAQAPGPAITAGGHFHGMSPQAGYPLTLGRAWTRLSASMPDPPAGAAFETVVLYVLAADGRVLLTRPFRV